MKVRWPDDTGPGLITSTVQVSDTVPKFGLITICVALCELIGRFAYTAPPDVLSVTVAPLTKLLPLIVNDCAAPVATGTAGLTLLIEGVRAWLDSEKSNPTIKTRIDAILFRRTPRTDIFIFLLLKVLFMATPCLPSLFIPFPHISPSLH